MSTRALLLAIALVTSGGCDGSEERTDTGPSVEVDVGTIDAHSDAGAPADAAGDAGTIPDAHIGDVGSSSDDASEVRSPVEIAITVHVENGTFDEAWWRVLEEYAARFEAHGAYLTLEPRNVATEADARRASPTLPRLRARGHAVGLHAALGATAGSTYDGFVRELVRQRATLEAHVGPVEHVSGNCASFDWVGGVAEAGFTFATAATVLCLMAIPAAERPPEFRDVTCRTPFDPIECHDPYPSEVFDTAHAWRATSGATWLTDSADGGLVILPGRGTIDCSLEQQRRDPPGDCVLTDDDIAITMDELDATIASRDPSRPAQLYWVWSYGRSLDVDALERFLSAVDERVARGEARWTTAGQVHASFVAWEASHR